MTGEMGKRDIEAIERRVKAGFRFDVWPAADG